MNKPPLKHKPAPHKPFPNPTLTKSSLLLLSRIRSDILSEEFEEPSWNGVPAREMCFQILRDIGMNDSILRDRIVSEVFRGLDPVDQDVERPSETDDAKKPGVQVEIIDLDEIESHDSHTKHNGQGPGQGQEQGVDCAAETNDLEDEDMPDLDDLLNQISMNPPVSEPNNDTQGKPRSQYFSGVSAGRSFSASSAVDAFLETRGESPRWKKK